MKLSIHAILYLLCASVVTAQCANASNSGQVIYNQYGQEVNMNSFIKKCRHVVESIWIGTSGLKDGAKFEDDLIDALAYVEYYTRGQHQRWFITNGFVKALYDNMKRFTYYTPDGATELPFDILIKSGKVGEFANCAPDDCSLIDMYCAKLLCGVAFKVFSFNGESEKSFNSIEEIERSINESGRVLTAGDSLSTKLRDHLIQKKIDIEQIAGKNGIKVSDIKGVDLKNYVIGSNKKAFLSFDASRLKQELKTREMAKTTDYGDKEYKREINKEFELNKLEYPIPLPKTIEELSELNNIICGGEITIRGKEIIEDMLMAPELTDYQRETLEILKAGQDSEKFQDACQAVRALIKHYELVEVLRQIKPSSKDLDAPTEEYMQEQEKLEMNAAERLNPLRPR